MKTEFNQQQYDSAYEDGIENHWWHLARNRIVLSCLRETGGAGAKVLDVGCGRGIAVKYLRAAGLDCEGVELANVRALPGVEKYVRHDTDAVTMQQEIRSGYATITLLDVIEHLPEPEAFLRALIAAFPNVERIVISVPARQEIWSNFDDYYGHFRRYDLNMLNQLALALDCRLERTEYFFHAPYVAARLLSGLKRDRSIRVDAPQAGAKWLHGLVAQAMWLDRSLLPARFPGTSALACMRINRLLPA